MSSHDKRAVTSSSGSSGRCSESNSQTINKNELKRKIIAIQARASVLKRQLNRKSVKEGASCVENEWQRCFEAISLLHADVLACDDDEVDVDLDKIACRVEDVLFEVKEEVSQVLKYDVDGRSSVNESCATSYLLSKHLDIPVDNISNVKVSERFPVNIDDNEFSPPQNQTHCIRKGSDTGKLEADSKVDFTKPTLNPGAVPFLGNVNNFPAAQVGYGQIPLPPAPRLNLDNFDGDVLKYWDFKRRFKERGRCIY